MRRSRERRSTVRRVWFDSVDQPYFELRCDGCQIPFVCWDAACYDWRLLRNAAMFTGWSAGIEGPTGPHYCPSCLRVRARTHWDKGSYPP